MNSSQKNVLPTEVDVLIETETINVPMPSPKVSFIESIGWKRCVLIGLVAVFFIALGYDTIYRVAWNDIKRTDYIVYSTAGQAVLDGTNIYEAHDSNGWFYVYPPPFAIVSIPFAKLSLAWGSALWYTVSLSGLALALVMSVRLARTASPPAGGKNDNWTLYESPLFLASPWIVSGLLRCQASEFMIPLVIAAVYFWWRGRPFLGGMSLAAASLLKAFPIALLAYFVWRRQWNFVGAFVLGMAIGGLILPATVFGWQKNLDYWQQWGGLVAGPALSANDAHQDNMLHGQLLDAKKPRNQSLESLLLSVNTPPKQAKLVLAILAVGMLAAMVWLARGADSRTQLVLVSAFVSWNLLIPPISESHYFGLMILPLAVLTSIFLGETDSVSRRLSLTALALFFCTTLWSNLDKDMHYYRLLCWATLGVWSCLLAVAYRRGKAKAVAYPAECIAKS